MRNNAKRGRGENSTNNYCRAGMNPVSIFFIRLHRRLLSLRQQIAETKSVACNLFADAECDRRLKHGAIENEGMEFTVFSAGIHPARQIGEEGRVQLAPRERGIEYARIDTDRDRPETLSYEFPSEFTGVALPDGKKRTHVNLSEIFFAVEAQVFEKNIPERHMTYAPREVFCKRFLHTLLVGCIDALWRDQDRVKRQAGRFTLPLEQHAANPMHADAVVILGNGREQRGDAAVAPCLEGVQRHGAVFSSAPAKENFFRHAGLTHGAWCISRRCETLAPARGSPARPGISCRQDWRCARRN